MDRKPVPVTIEAIRIAVSALPGARCGVGDLTLRASSWEELRALRALPGAEEYTPRGVCFRLLPSGETVAQRGSGGRLGGWLPAHDGCYDVRVFLAYGVDGETMPPAPPVSPLSPTIIEAAVKVAGLPVLGLTGPTAPAPACSVKGCDLPKGHKGLCKPLGCELTGCRMEPVCKGCGRKGLTDEESDALNAAAIAREEAEGDAPELADGAPVAGGA